MFIIMYIIIYIYIYNHLRGNHLSNTTRLTHMFFKRGE